MEEDLPRPYDLFLLAISLYVLGALAFDSLVKLQPETKTILEYVDCAVCTVFLVDFVIRLATTKNRISYFFKWGWIDLLSSIPTLDALRWGRLARIARVLRVLRGVRSVRLLTRYALRKRAEATFSAVALLTAILIVFSSIAILHFEPKGEANILTADDALWWAYTTVTTVGYGDKYPISGEGRILAALLMLAGVGLFGTFAGFVASWFLGGEKKCTEDSVSHPTTTSS